MNKEILYKLYIEEQKNPYEIADILSMNHKTIRSYLKKYNIPLRTASEYNFLAKKNYINPSKESLSSPISIAAHTAYLCEGWHTKKTNYISFCNQDPNLINLIIKCLEKIYFAKSISISILGKTHNECEIFHKMYISSNVIIDKNRKNPIIRVKCGGKMLARDFISNAYMILSNLT